jgi:hypothetical protein
MPTFSLDAADASELAGLLQFIDGWLQSDRGILNATLAEFTGSPASGPTHSATTSPGSGSSSASPTARAYSPRTSGELTPLRSDSPNYRPWSQQDTQPWPPPQTSRLSHSPSASR